ncbi:MAG: type II toxin-antitoxin system HicA family toxin [Candidatus Sungbacteria bacterium]|nr:type II toxin-antitoxin system HicA family toxin [Candidatus Sungbacteria bacterium]
MPKLYSSQYIVKVLEFRGFVFVSQRGSHAKYRRKVVAGIHTVIVPMNKREIPYGTFRSIVRQSHLREEDFENI